MYTKIRNPKSDPAAAGRNPKSKGPRVSIGLPVYNGERFLPSALDSLLAQRFEDFELIISDNASTDRTQEICRDFAARDERIRYYRNRENLGAAKNYNRVFELSSGEYFKWAAHDDICDQNFVGKCVAVLENNPSVVLCYPKTRIIDAQGRLITEYNKQRDTYSPRPERRFHDMVLLHANCFEIFGVIRSDILRKTRLIGRYGGSDRVLLGELALHGPFFEIPGYLFLRREHVQSSSSAFNLSSIMVWFDPQKASQITLPRWRLLKENAISVKRGPLEWHRRVRCYAVLMKWIHGSRKALIYDLAMAIKQFVHKFQADPHRQMGPLTSTSMRILIYAHLFPPANSGMPYANLEIAKGLKALGHGIRVVACHNRGVKRLVRGLDFPVRLLPKWPFAPMHSLSGKGLLNWVFVPWYFLAIRDAIGSFKPDVILVTDETANTFWGVWARTVEVPFISLCSVPYLDKIEVKGQIGLLRELRLPIHRQLRGWLRNSYMNAKLILAVSNSTKNKLSEAASEFRTKIRVVPCSIDDRFFATPVDSQKTKHLKRKLKIEEDHFVLLSVARLTMAKGIDDVIRALSGLKAENLRRIRYLVIGKGEAETYLKELTGRFNLARNVIFMNEVPQLQLIPYYDISDLYIMPSHTESFGRVFVEAAARSKPSVGSRVGGITDIIGDGETGFLISTGDIKGLQDLIVRLCSDLEKVRTLGRNARRKAEHNYTSERIARAIEAQLSKVGFRESNQKTTMAA